MDMLPRHNHNSFCSETRMSLSQLYECQLLPNCPEKSCCGSPMAAYPSTSLHHGRFATIAITSYENRLFIIKMRILIKLKNVSANLLAQPVKAMPKCLHTEGIGKGFDKIVYMLTF